MTDMLGHNLPETLDDLLAETYADLLMRYDELIEAVDRVPASCDDDETANKMTDFAGQISFCMKKAKAAHKIEKEPHLNAGRTVDKFFGDIVKPLERHKGAIEAIVGQYQWRKQEAARKAAQEAERIAREEAERLAALAQSEADVMAAIEQEEMANEQAAIAAARPVELSRIHGDLATGSLMVEYDFAIEDINLVPQRFLMVNESAIKSYIRSRPQDEAPVPVPGLRFIPRYVTRIRS